jgi:hypothetical protein
MVDFVTLVVFIGLASLGLRTMPLRKALMAGALLVNLYVLPL